jgi:hypothetical protein
MNKKGQLTIFIFVGILFVGIITGFFIISKNLNFLDKNKSETGYIENVIEKCITRRALDSTRIIGLQGGHIKLPEIYLATSTSNIGAGYFEGKKTLPSIKEMQEEINNYMSISVNECIRESDFPRENINFINEPLIRSTINKESIEISSRIYLIIENNNKSYEINKEFKKSLPIKLGNLHKIALDIIEKTDKDPNYIDLSYIYNLGYYVIFFPTDQDTIIYAITDPNSVVHEIDEIPYTFVFAVKIGEKNE